jgi:8-oxo-dGTP pyrophosphatase MutT (NUDIX family)
MNDSIKFQNFIEMIRKKLADPLPGIEAQQKMAVSARLSTLDPRQSVSAAVLVLIYPFQGFLHTVFMKRTDYDGPHGGQISFPGGKSESIDKDIIQTALREAFEEVGIQPDSVDVLGLLSKLFIPISNFEVQPVVGYANSRPHFEIDRKEVNCLIEMKLDELRSPECKFQKMMNIKGSETCVPYYNAKGYHVWGATAMILSEFLEILTSLFYDN